MVQILLVVVVKDIELYHHGLQLQCCMFFLFLYVFFYCISSLVAFWIFIIRQLMNKYKCNYFLSHELVVHSQITRCVLSINRISPELIRINSHYILIHSSNTWRTLSGTRRTFGVARMIFAALQVLRSSASVLRMLMIHCELIYECSASAVRCCTNSLKSNCGHHCFDHSQNNRCVWRLAAR